MSGLIPWGKRQFTDGNGNPLVGGWVAYCQPGTGGAVFRNVYGDEAETVLLQNPVPLDASGRPYSGGSQQSLWGDGQYEEFVYDSMGVLQTSSIIDTPLESLSGNVTIDGTLTVNGNEVINGNLTTNGNTTTSGNDNIGGALAASTADISGNETVGGTLQAGTVTSLGDVNVGGNVNDANGTGTFNTVNANSGTITNLNVPGTLNAGTINASQINGPGEGGGLPGIQTGSGTITTQTIDGDSGGFAIVNFSAVNNLGAIIVQQVSPAASPQGDLSPALVIRNVSNSQFTIHMIGYNPSTPVPVNFYWVVFGQ